MDKFLLEIFDKRFHLYFVLDDAYLEKLRNNPNVRTNDSFTARIRSLHQSRYNIQFDTFASEETSTESNSPRPDHVVIWLDAHIGRPENHRHMKKYFKSIIAVNWPNLFSLPTDDDIDNLIRVNDVEVVNDFNVTDITDEIYAFSNCEDCRPFIQKVFKSERHIFFICSGHLGREFVPEIYSNKFIHSIYILSINISRHYEWACDYREKILIFSHELDLLARLARDIAGYYEKKTSDGITKHPRHILTYLYWTKRLLSNANIVDRDVTSTSNLQDINRRIEDLEKDLRSNCEAEEKEKSGIACTDM